LTTLERLLKEKAGSAHAAAAQKVYDEQVDLVAGKDRERKADFAGDREAVTRAILSLIAP
jgi:hypothetical protein